jgi:hypothetical protein
MWQISVLMISRNIQHPLFESPQIGLDEFADYCLHTMDAASSEPMVSYIKRFQNRGRET